MTNMAEIIISGFAHEYGIPVDEFMDIVAGKKRMSVGLAAGIADILNVSVKIIQDQHRKDLVANTKAEVE